MWIFVLACILAWYGSVESQSLGPTAMQSNVSWSDMNALHTLFNATNGRHWYWRDSGNRWNFTKDESGEFIHDPCADMWQGICCSSAALNMSLHCSYGVNNSYVYYDQLIKILALTSAQENTVIGLSLPFFNLSGILPSDIFNISTLSYLVFPWNRLSGSIPPIVGKLNHFAALDLQFNLMSGSIPPEIGSTNLTLLSVNNNKFTGTIPPEVSQLRYMANFIGTKNQFSGTMPTGFGSLTSLIAIQFGYNHLSQTVPSSICELHHVTNIELDENMFTGTLPSCLTVLTGLTVMYMSVNQFTGTVPSAWGESLHAMTNLYVDNNLFTGTIPTSIGSMLVLTILDMYDNQLTGTIPSKLSDLKELTELELYGNKFTGQIPTELGLLRSLTNMYLQSNWLTGTIPTALGHLDKLLGINLENNLLSSTIPSTLGSLQALNSVLLHGNYFSGSPDNVFTHSQSALITIDLSDNNFSGTLPLSLFRLPNISTIALIKNCFSGSLSTDICSSVTVETLALDGLTAGAGCKQPLFGSSYSVQRFIQGSIPTCLYGMKSLGSLLLSGNGLSGTLPGDDSFQISSTLRNMSFAHNRMSGTIPNVFQEHNFDLLDLSFNRISGTVDNMYQYYNLDVHPKFASDTPKQLVLQVNRLSGTLPDSFLDVDNIQVVSGNLFTCNEQGLPENDPGTADSQCGSNYLNAVLGVWGIIFVLQLLFIGLIMWGIKSAGYNLRQFGDFPKYYQLLIDWITIPSNLSFHSNLKLMRRLSIAWTLVALTVFMISELILKYVSAELFSTHSFQYAYTPSLAFLNSNAPATWLVIAVCLFMSCIYYNLRRMERKVTEAIMQRPMLSVLTEKTLLLLVIIVNVAVMLAVNGLYLYVAVNNTQSLIFLTQVALSFFKLAWNGWWLPHIVNRMTPMGLDGFSRFPRMTMTAMMVFNYVIAPVITILLTNSNCFYNVFVEPPAVDVTFIHSNVCFSSVSIDSISVGCLNYPTAVTLSYSPPFIYSYQCSSSLLVYYTPVFVLMYIYVGFISPLMVVFVKHEQAKVIKSAGWQWVLNHIGHDIMRDERCLQSAGVVRERESEGGQGLASTDENASSNLAPVAVQGPLLNAQNVTSMTICHLATLVTYGLAYPLLAVVICVAVTTSSLQWQALLGRYTQLCDSAPPAQRAFMEQRLKRSCAGVQGMLYESRWILVLVMGIFFAFFAFDMIGGAANDDWRAMLWAPVTLVAWPVVMWVVTEALCCCRSLVFDNSLASEIDIHPHHTTMGLSLLTSDEKVYSVGSNYSNADDLAQADKESASLRNSYIPPSLSAATLQRDSDVDVVDGDDATGDDDDDDGHHGIRLSMRMSLPDHLLVRNSINAALLEEVVDLAPKDQESCI